MFRYVLVAIILVIAGCSRSAQIVSYKGAYYMAGDAACRTFDSITAIRVMCYDGDNKPTGWRDAMSGQDIQIYMMQQQINARQMESLNESIRQLGTSLNAPQPQYNYVAPQVMPLSAPGGNQVRCITTGIYTNCRY